MNPRLHLFVLLAFCSMAAMPQSESSQKSSMAVVPRSKLCITEGQISQLSGNKLSVSVPKMRAFVTDPILQEAEARFRYLGSSKQSVPLASGEMRRQIGLKLRAANGCNLVYAMWRIEPKAELVVSVKNNPGMTSSSECDAHGYQDVKPAHAGLLPKIKSGSSHSLRAIMDGSTMRVYADQKLVWEGDVGASALTFDGPVGIRTDNGRFEFELFAAKPGPAQHGATAACRAHEKEE
jgi:hypothetical protein